MVIIISTRFNVKTPRFRGVLCSIQLELFVTLDREETVSWVFVY